jgi:glycosyltransferase involved in cell wall biosynthesis
MKIAVVVFCRDRPSYLRETLQSVSKQEYRDFDVIVSDNSSEAANASLNEAIAQEELRGMRAVYRRQSGKLTMCGHFFSVIPSLANQYGAIAIHNDDDVWMPAHLSKAVAALRGNSSTLLSIANAVVIDSEGREIAPLFCSKAPPAGESRSKQLAFWVKSFWGTYPGYVVRSELLQTLPRVETQQLDGWIAWWCLASGSDINYIKEPTFRYRRHADQITNRGQSVLADKHRLRIDAFRRYGWKFSKVYPGFPLKVLKSALWRIAMKNRIKRQFAQ